MQRQDVSCRPRRDTTEREDRAIVRTAVAASDSTLSTIQRVRPTSIQNDHQQTTERAESKRSPTVTMPTPHTRTPTSPSKVIVRIPLDPVWISWNKVRPRLTRAISPKPWSLGGRLSVCQSWCCGFVTDPMPLVAATVNRWRQILTFILTGEATIASIDDILRPVLLPLLTHHPELTCQPDNAQPHTACVTMDCLQSCRTLPWPVRSPDLSPIEYIWNVMERRLQPSQNVVYG
ncbi:hypothetical protein LAZ67_8003491 [Cordylochernes scorpioides]|uniref:Tc1-like transposase DDE domain-containing protein n=1 Tax=Cordylochernes scorpioides TaxID=51811 RepID=A0ABY6KRL8_9ARAC|nr:hypothetical protein LAZ67_8003491 [Cordylochernes scorpioides]